MSTLQLVNTLANLIYIYGGMIFLANYINKTFIHDHLINYPFTLADQPDRIFTMSRYLLLLYNICSSLSSEDYESIINRIFSGFTFQLCLLLYPNPTSSAILETSSSITEQ